MQCTNLQVILGWTDKTLFSIGELAEMLTDSAHRGGTLVVMGELPTYEMGEEVATRLRASARA